LADAPFDAPASVLAVVSFLAMMDIPYQLVGLYSLFKRVFLGVCSVTSPSMISSSSAYECGVCAPKSGLAANMNKAFKPIIGDEMM
jgi:hypothetical protein